MMEAESGQGMLELDQELIENDSKLAKSSSQINIGHKSSLVIPWQKIYKLVVQKDAYDRERSEFVRDQLGKYYRMVEGGTTKGSKQTGRVDWARTRALVAGKDSERMMELF